MLRALGVGPIMALALAAPVIAHAAPDYWRVYVIRNATSNVLGFLDAVTIRPDGGYKDFWVTAVVFPGDARYAKGIRYFLTENHADCVARTHQSGLELIHFADGHTEPAPGWEPWSTATPGTLGAALVDFACAPPSRWSSLGLHMASHDIRKLLVEISAPN